MAKRRALKLQQLIRFSRVGDLEQHVFVFGAQQKISVALAAQQFGRASQAIRFQCHLLSLFVPISWAAGCLGS